MTRPGETAVPDAGAVPDVAGVARGAGPVALGVLLRQGARFPEAEDAVQEALAMAVESWAVRGLPDRPVGWVVRVAQRRLVDALRAETARQRREVLAASWAATTADPVIHDDDSLLLLFLCCHPSITPSAAIPLTLRAVGGLTTREIADVLLVNESTIGQRISRAKATIARSGDPFVRPPADLLEARLADVMQIIYLIFTEGHTVSVGDHLGRPDLADEAIRLARLLHDRLPDDPEATGLLALLLLTDARRPARTDDRGEFVPLDRQDRRRWRRHQITEGLTLLTRAMRHHAMGTYQLQAAIAAVHDQAAGYAETRWSDIRILYDRLAALEDHPVVHLNRAIAIAHTDGVQAALDVVTPLSASLAEHHRYHATVGYLHDANGDDEAARQAYRRAAALAVNEPERRHLLRQAERA